MSEEENKWAWPAWYGQLVSPDDWLEPVREDEENTDWADVHRLRRVDELARLRLKHHGR